MRRFNLFGSRITTLMLTKLFPTLLPILFSGIGMTGGPGEVEISHTPVIVVVQCTALGQNQFEDLLLNDLRKVGVNFEVVWCLNKNPEIAREDISKIQHYALENEVEHILRIQYFERGVTTGYERITTPKVMKGEVSLSLHRVQEGVPFISGEPLFWINAYTWKSLLQKLEKKLTKG